MTPPRRYCESSTVQCVVGQLTCSPLFGTAWTSWSGHRLSALLDGTLAVVFWSLGALLAQDLGDTG